MEKCVHLKGECYEISPDARNGLGWMHKSIKEHILETLGLIIKKLTIRVKIRRGHFEIIQEIIFFVSYEGNIWIAHPKKKRKKIILSMFN